MGRGQTAARLHRALDLDELAGGVVRGAAEVGRLAGDGVDERAERFSGVRRVRLPTFDTRLHSMERLDSEEVEGAGFLGSPGLLLRRSGAYGALSRFQRFSTSRLVGGLRAPVPKLIVPAANTMAPDRR